MNRDVLHRLNNSVLFLKNKQIIKTQKDLADRMNLNHNSISQALKGNPKYLTDRFIKNLCFEFDILNCEYILNGLGGLTKKKSLPIKNTKEVSLQHQIDLLHKKVSEQEKEIEEMKILLIKTRSK